MATVTETPAAPFSSDLAAEVAPDALQRFLRYVRIDTQSRDGSETYPSTLKQLDLSRLLVEELREIGLSDAALDEHGYVMATLPATAGVDAPGGRPDRPRGYQPGRQRHGRLPAPRAALRRRGDHVQRRSGPGLASAREPGAARPGGARPGDQRRDDAPGGRRQGGGGGDHGRRGLPGAPPGAGARGAAGGVHPGRGDRAGDEALQPGALRRRGGLHGGRVAARRDRGRDLLRLQRYRHHPGPQRPPRLRQRQDGQQPQAGRGPDQLAPDRRAGPGDDLRPGGLRAPQQHRGQRGADGAALHRARLRRGAAGGPRTAPAAAGR